MFLLSLFLPGLLAEENGTAVANQRPDLLSNFWRMAVEEGVEDYEALYSDYQTFIIPNLKKERKNQKQRLEFAENGARISRGYCVTLPNSSIEKVDQKEWGFSGNMNMTVNFEQFTELKISKDSFVEIELSARGKKSEIELIPGNIQRPFINYIQTGFNTFQMQCKFSKLDLRTIFQSNHFGCRTLTNVVK